MRLSELPITFLSASAHKIYGPKGIGLLYHNSHLISDLPPLLKGGGHENSRRSGTLAVPLIAAFGKACSLISNADDLKKEQNRLGILRDQLFKGLLEIFPNIKINTPLHKSVTSHLHISLQAPFRLPKVLMKIAASRASA